MHYAKYLATGYFDMYFYALLKLNSKVKLEHLLHIFQVKNTSMNIKIGILK